MKEKPIVAGIGELLWDILPSGKHLGGAPCNFTFHAMQTDCAGFIVSATGNDELGDELTKVITELGLSTRYLQKNEHPTSTVSVELDKNGQPEFHIHENVAWDHIKWNKNMESLAGDLDAVCFGTLAQRNPESEFSIKSFIAATKPECLKIFDVNLRQNYYSKEAIINSLNFSDILKLNEDELPVLSDYFGFSGSAEKQVDQILRYFGLKFVVYTLGSKGSIVMSETEVSFTEAPKIKIADTVGAGDAFTAVFMAGLLKGIPLKETHEKATRAAAYVCTQKGATPKLPWKIF